MGWARRGSPCIIYGVHANQPSDEHTVDSSAPCVGGLPGLLFDTKQNKAKQNPRPEWPLAGSCVLQNARGLLSLLAAVEVKEEEKDPGVCPELNPKAGVGKPTLL